jgi:hypothetical protein
MIAALNSMGESRTAYECTPFGVEALHDPNRTGTGYKAA